MADDDSATVGVDKTVAAILAAVRLARRVFGNQPLAAFEEIASWSETAVHFEEAPATDGKLAVGVRGIDYHHEWTTTKLDGTREDHLGCALYVVVLNRTRSPIRCFRLGDMSRLVDDRGYQCRPRDSGFYWVGDDGRYNDNGDAIAPRAKLDGLLLFPSLRSGSKRVKRLSVVGEYWLAKSDGYRYECAHDIPLRPARW